MKSVVWKFIEKDAENGLDRLSDEINNKVCITLKDNKSCEFVFFQFTQNVLDSLILIRVIWTLLLSLFIFIVFTIIVIIVLL